MVSTYVSLVGTPLALSPKVVDRGGLRVVLAPQGPSPSRAPSVIAEIFHYHGHEIIQGLIGFFGVSQLLEDFSGTSGNTHFMSNPTSNE